MAPTNTAQERISHAIGEWLKELQEYPGWREWKRLQIGHTLYFDDEFMPLEKSLEDFEFSPEMEKKHAVMMLYIELASAAHALRDVEWYFRRYPFSRTPVSRANHLTYCCEMYFGRFYQFRERLKKLSKAVKDAVPDHGLDFGKFIKAFNKEFDQEIRARNSVHHHEAFNDVAITRIALLGLTGTSDDHERLTRSHYRKATREWASRTRRNSEKLDQFVDAVAEALLNVCPFLVAKDG